MTCINSLLESPLFSDFRMRNRLKIFIETKLGIRDERGYLENPAEIINTLCEAKDFINFEHDIHDSRLQKFFFLFLIHSLNQFPDEANWISFLDEGDEIKSQHIIEGVSRVWLDFQTQLIQHDLFIEQDPDELDIFFN